MAAANSEREGNRSSAPVAGNAGNGRASAPERRTSSGGPRLAERTALEARPAVRVAAAARIGAEARPAERTAPEARPAERVAAAARIGAEARPAERTAPEARLAERVAAAARIGAEARPAERTALEARLAERVAAAARPARAVAGGVRRVRPSGQATHRHRTCASPRRFALPLLALMFLALPLLLVGCAEAEPDMEPAPAPETSSAIVLDYWTPFSGGDYRFMSDMVEAFNREHPGIQIRQTNSRLDDYYQRLRTAILAGQAPDVAIVHTSSLPQFVSNGYLEPLSEPIRRVGLDWNGLNRNVSEGAVFDGQTYAVPIDTHALVMYYNKDHLAAAGLLDADGKPVLDASPDGFEAFLSAIRDAVPPDVAPLAQPSTRIDAVWLWWSLYNQMEGGGGFYNEARTEAVLDHPKALEALRYVHGLYESGLIPPHINDAFKLFAEGKAAVLMTGMWATGALEHAEGLRFGVVPLPVLYDRPAAWGDSHTLAVPTKLDMSDAKRDAILTFAKWTVERGELWAKAGHVPSSTAVVESDAYRALDYRSDYAAVADDVAFWPRHPKQREIIEVLIKEFERMNYGLQSPEEALRVANERVNAEIRP